MGAEDPNSGLKAHVANILLTEISSQPLQPVYLKDNSKIHYITRAHHSKWQYGVVRLVT